MSARRAVNNAGLKHVTLVARKSRLALSQDDIVFHKGGIEFRTSEPFATWTEMTLTLHSPLDHSKLHCSGVVIACTGNRHQGYHVSMVFTGLTKHGAAALSAMARAH